MTSRIFAVYREGASWERCCLINDAALIDLNTRLDDAHINLDGLKFVFIRVYTHV